WRRGLGDGPGVGRRVWLGVPVGRMAGGLRGERARDGSAARPRARALRAASSRRARRPRLPHLRLRDGASLQRARAAHVLGGSARPGRRAALPGVRGPQYLRGPVLVATGTGARAVGERRALVAEPAPEANRAGRPASVRSDAAQGAAWDTASRA